jgi:hypothetical protein
VSQITLLCDTCRLNSAQNFNDRGLIGAGVAQIELVNDEPTVTHRYGSRGYWWPADKYAHYGDKAAYRDERSDYIYIWGGPPNHTTDMRLSQYSYLARVKAKQAFELDKYEYWWGKDRRWRKEMLDEFGPETAAMWGAGQGQVVYSEHFGRYLFVNVWPGKSILDVILDSVLTAVQVAPMSGYGLHHRQRGLGRQTWTSIQRLLSTADSSTALARIHTSTIAARA